eukprot:CAMPEP_0204585820 /NCGR_PEP_ID=MMETSP0661-20131031/47139_1 /ASSEMBLY_ACC=CAM_ASM_000606 /TAXON_ID=109239 /ORGANISM="Alexandrium margalefi, Strain AMGDE01CS-322" /LENGTH=243 /DNA_ID=CAMNT_0051595407 /DNA_START=65 /DNA_END=794 /DNA_ORIENTATION=+
MPQATLGGAGAGAGHAHDLHLREPARGDVEGAPPDLHVRVARAAVPQQRLEVHLVPDEGDHPLGPLGQPPPAGAHAVPEAAGEAGAAVRPREVLPEDARLGHRDAGAAEDALASRPRAPQRAVDDELHAGLAHEVARRELPGHVGHLRPAALHERGVLVGAAGAAGAGDREVVAGAAPAEEDAEGEVHPGLGPDVALAPAVPDEVHRLGRCAVVRPVLLPRLGVRRHPPDGQKMRGPREDGTE